MLVCLFVFHVLKPEPIFFLFLFTNNEKTIFFFFLQMSGRKYRQRSKVKKKKETVVMFKPCIFFMEVIKTQAKINLSNGGGGSHNWAIIERVVSFLFHGQIITRKKKSSLIVSYLKWMCWRGELCVVCREGRPREWREIKKRTCCVRVRKKKTILIIIYLFHSLPFWEEKNNFQLTTRQGQTLNQESPCHYFCTPFFSSVTPLTDFYARSQTKQATSLYYWVEWRKIS